MMRRRDAAQSRPCRLVLIAVHLDEHARDPALVAGDFLRVCDRRERDLAVRQLAYFVARQGRTDEGFAVYATRLQCRVLESLYADFAGDLRRQEDRALVRELPRREAPQQRPAQAGK